jgi:hypothetical protein
LKHEAEKRLAASNAFTFVLMTGVVNLFDDMTYEGGASINGPSSAHSGLLPLLLA